MPILVRFMLKHALLGYAVALVFTGVLLSLDIGGLATLIRQSSVGLLAVGLLFFFTGLTFGSLQMGIAVMSLRPEPCDDDRAGPSLEPVAVAVPQRVSARRR